MTERTFALLGNTGRRDEGRLELVCAFPGQGEFSVNALLQCARKYSAVYGAMRETFEATDEVALEEGLPPVGRSLLGPTPPSGRQMAEAAAGTAQLAHFAVSVALYRALRAVLGTPDRFLAVSFGEIAALVAAGSLDVCDGARVACRLARYMAAHRGAMLLVHAGERDTTELLGARPGTGLALACVNDPSECVVSGPAAAITDLEQLVLERQIPASRLKLDLLAHHPDLSHTADAFCSYLQGVPLRRPAVPVHSAVNGLYTSRDQLARGLANCLVLPVRLPSVVLAAATSSAVVLEVGTGESLTRNILRTMPEGQVTAYNPLRTESFSWDPLTGAHGRQSSLQRAAEGGAS
ncbi:acyltransferase domain-containing protein [Streptomyces broussonetiae]|uniref:Acyltransferase domain-containing protein n=1 Tax=Streptomyces broussonetiae TaxID=2686304 RepID=A0ABV5EMB6_9ACTN